MTTYLSNQIKNRLKEGDLITFPASVNPYTFTMPEEVEKVKFSLMGAKGLNGNGVNHISTGGAGGAGGSVVGYFTFKDVRQLFIRVAKQNVPGGGKPGSSSFDTNIAGTGYGGGYTDVRLGSSIVDNRIAVAAGGGGGGMKNGGDTTPTNNDGNPGGVGTGAGGHRGGNSGAWSPGWEGEVGIVGAGGGGGGAGWYQGGGGDGGLSEAKKLESPVFTTGANKSTDGFFQIEIITLNNKLSVINGPSASLGNKSNLFAFDYSATDADNESITSKVTLNGTTIDTATSATGNIANRTIKIPQNVWDELTINTAHTIIIAVTDAKGETATTTHIFTKVNAAPTAQIVEPKGDAVTVPIVDKTQPILVWNFKDTDIGDVQSAYQVVIEDINGLIVHDSTKKIGTASYYQVPINLEWTKTYKWKVTVWDRYDVPSNPSEFGFFKPNRAPNLTGITPGSTDKLLPSKVGSTPVYTWTFEDLDVEAQAAYQLQIFQTADDAIVYNTNRVSKNVQTHTIPDNVLLPGVGYYAILTVWDPNNLFAKSEKLYIATNATPSAPTLTRPIDNFRTPIKPVLAAVIGTDPENDKQHFKIQLSQDKDFATGVVEFSSLTSRVGWKVDGFDIPVEGVDNSSAGKSVELTLQTNLEKNKTYYWRMAAIDNNTKAVGKYSAARKIRVGNRIEYNTLKRQIPTEATAARRILVALDYTLAKDGATPSTIRVYVSNNALDVTPTWEEATIEFFRQDYYTFKNSTKTAAKFGVGVKVVVQANDSMEPISINAAGITFD